MNPYERFVLPRLINAAMRQPPIMQLRQQVVPAADGVVLELGMGSGLNLPFYGDRVERVVAVDPSAELHALAADNLARAPVPVEFLQMGGEHLPLERNSVDTVLTTWTLCSIPDVYRALREVRRVLRPGGQVLFAEHGVHPEQAVQRWQRRVSPLWKAIGGGCHLDRDPPGLLQMAGFRLTGLEQGAIPGPRIATWMYHGRAVPI